MADNRTLSITIVATSEKAQAELRKLADEADHLGLRTGAAAEKIGKAGEKHREYGERTHAAFNAVQIAATSVGASLGPLGDVLERFSVGLEHTDERAGRMRRGLQLAGAAMSALGGIITIESARDQASLAQLETAVTNTGNKWDDYAHHLENVAGAQAKYGHSNKDALDALTKLTAAFNSPDKAIEHMGLAADVAARQHISLSDAAGLVAKVVGGSFRPLQQYGINLRNLADPVKELTAAQHELASATSHLTDAQQNLSDFEARLHEQESQGAAEHAARVEAAKAKVADAEQHLADVVQRNAEQTKARQDAANEAVTSSTEKLASARDRLADIEQRVHEKTQISLQDQFSMRDAQQSLADIQQKIADGQLVGADAANALRDAQQKVSDEAALQAEKHKVTAAETAELTKAQQAATKAAKEHADAIAKAKTAGAQTTSEHNAARDAVAGVADAHAGLAKAQASGSGGETLAQHQQERKLRDEVTAAAGRQATALRKLAAAKADEAEFGSKVEAALKLWEDKVQGSADAQSKTLDGMFHHFLASTQNAFAKLGPGIGLGLVAASSALQIFMAASKARWLTYAAETIAVNVRVGAAILAETVSTGLATLASWIATHAAMLASSIASAAGILLAWAPVIIGVALIGIAAYELYKHWDQVWGFIKGIAEGAWHFIKKHMDLIIDIALGPLGVAINLIRHHWDAVWGAIKTSASGVKDFFVSAFSGIEHIVLAPFQGAITLLNSIIRAIDSIHFSFRAPSWLGGWGWTFKGFGIPEIPNLPSFSDGGVVPGRDGEPALVIAHGGERILNRGQQAGQWGSAPARLDVHIDLTGAYLGDERTLQRFSQQIGKHVLEEFHRMQNQGRNLRLVSR